MEGFIYKTQSYKEHAKLLFVYTEMGKITLIAQGVQKLNQPTRILAQYLTKIGFDEVKDKRMYSLKNGTIIQDYKHIKDDYDALKQCALILEVLNHMIYDDLDHKRIYHDLMRALSSPKVDLGALSFTLRMLYHLGYGLDLKPKHPKVKGISIDSGGLIYDDDIQSVDLDVKAATTLLQLIHQPYIEDANYEQSHIDQIKQFTLKYYQFHLQTTLKSLQ